MSMIGKLMNIVSLPLRVAAAPIKITEDLVEAAVDGKGRRGIKRATVGTARYVATGRSGHGSSLDGFFDFDDE